MRPNNDTLYPIAWLDLSSEPVALSVPDMKNRYYVMPFMDAWTNVFDMVGTRATGTGHGSWMVAGPGWKGEVPPDVKVIHSPTNMCWLIGRIQTNAESDIPNVHKFQRQFTLTPLAHWADRRANPAITRTDEDSTGITADPALMVAKMSADEFFGRLSRLMKEQPPAAMDAPILKILKRFGIEPGRRFRMDNTNAEATSENALVGKAMGRRAMWQFGNQLPASARGLVDCGIGNAVGLGEFGFLEPTVIVDYTPQEMILDDVRFVFQNIPHSEAPAEMAFYLPDFKACCGAEILNQTLHQILTLRGAKVRDTLLWANYIDEGLRLFGAAEVCFTLHNWPVWGNGRIIEFMKMHRDAYKYIHDQTVRMINAGMRPDDIAAAIKLPASLENFFAVRGYYGTARRNARAVYQHYLGWFDGNPANLDPLPRQEAAKRYLELMGGGEQALKAAQEAFNRGEYPWVAELLNHAVFARPDWTPPRELLAQTYDQLGYGAECPLDRNLYLTGAQELRSGEKGPAPDPVKSMEVMARMPIENFLIAMAATLDGPKAEGKDFKVNLVFSDLGESYAFWLENAVLHHRKGAPAGNADATLTLTKGIFLKMVAGQAALKDLMGDEFEVEGSRIDLVRFFSLFKKPEGSFPIVTP